MKKGPFFVKKMYPLSGDRLGVGSSFYSKVVKFYAL